MEETKKYPPRIESLLRERGLLDKSKEEKRKSHRKAMELIEKKFTKEERQGLIKSYETIR